MCQYCCIADSGEKVSCSCLCNVIDYETVTCKKCNHGFCFEEVNLKDVPDVTIIA